MADLERVLNRPIFFFSFNVSCYSRSAVLCPPQLHFDFDPCYSRWGIASIFFHSGDLFSGCKLVVVKDFNAYLTGWSPVVDIFWILLKSHWQLTSFII